MKRQDKLLILLYLLVLIGFGLFAFRLYYLLSICGPDIFCLFVLS